MMQNLEEVEKLAKAVHNRAHEIQEADGVDARLQLIADLAAAEELI
jgi:hypothetical protein